MERYEEIPHTADIGLKAYGRSQGELFQNAAYGMFDIIADLDELKKSVSVDIELRAGSREELLVAWLDELLYNFYTKGIIFCEFEIIDMGRDRLKARALGRHVGSNRSRLKTEIKAVTFHDLEIKEKDGVFSVEIIFDV